MAFRSDRGPHVGLIAILFREEEAERFATLIEAQGRALVGAPTAVEFQMVALGQAMPLVGANARLMLQEAPFEVVPFDTDHRDAAIAAFERYGKGRRHPAGLNYGDCMAYAVAKVAGCPLLFKGNDFIHTDIARAG